MEEKNSEKSEVDDALNIAKTLRQNILSGKGTLESHLLGFYSVAQILGKNDNEKWADCELNGYKKVEDIPDYRRTVFAMIYQNNIKKGRTNKALEASSASHIEQFSKTKEDYVITHVNAKNKLGKIIEEELGHVLGDDIFLHIPNFEFAKLIGSIRHELIKRLNVMVSEIIYGKILQGIFTNFQNKVNKRLSESNPDAVSELNIAYEGLGNSEDPERIAHVAFACRRLIKAIADNLFPAKKGGKHILKGGDSMDIGEENFLNRLTVFIDLIDSPNRKFIIREIGILRDLYGEIPESINKGTHLKITNADAERLLIYTYIILGDIILESAKRKN